MPQLYVNMPEGKYISIVNEKIMIFFLDLKCVKITSSIVFVSNNFWFFKRSWLAETPDGHDNHWIVDQLLQRLGDQNPSGEPQLEEPHYEDEWWIGAKSYVSFKQKGQSRL